VVKEFKCRPGCGACCIVISISSPVPGMPHGKPAGVRCLHLDERNCCLLFGLEERPAVCSSLIPSMEMCGNNYHDAAEYLEMLEYETAPDCP